MSETPFHPDDPPNGAGHVDLQAILHTAVDRGASDVHLKVGRPPIVRFDGYTSRPAAEFAAF